MVESDSVPVRLEFSGHKDMAFNIYFSAEWYWNFVDEYDSKVSRVSARLVKLQLIVIWYSPVMNLGAICCRIMKLVTKRDWFACRKQQYPKTLILTTSSHEVYVITLSSSSALSESQSKLLFSSVIIANCISQEGKAISRSVLLFPRCLLNRLTFELEFVFRS